MPKVTQIKCAHCGMTLYATDDQESCPVCGKDPRKPEAKSEAESKPESESKAEVPTESSAAQPQDENAENENAEPAQSGIAPVFASSESASPEGESHP